MIKTTILGIVAVAIIGIGITAAYAGPNPMITLAGDVTVDGVTELEGKLLDTNDDAGTAGQVLSSTGTGTDWVNSPESFTQIINLRTEITVTDTFVATSTGPFFVDACADNSSTGSPDFMQISGFGAVAMRIDIVPFDGKCIHVGEEANQSIGIGITANDGVSIVFITLRTTSSAIASIT